MKQRRGYRRIVSLVHSPKCEILIATTEAIQLKTDVKHLGQHNESRKNSLCKQNNNSSENLPKTEAYVGILKKDPSIDVRQIL